MENPSVEKPGMNQRCSYYGCKKAAVTDELYKQAGGTYVWLYWCERHSKPPSAKEKERNNGD